MLVSSCTDELLYSTTYIVHVQFKYMLPPYDVVQHSLDIYHGYQIALSTTPVVVRALCSYIKPCSLGYVYLISKVLNTQANVCRAGIL